MNKVGHLSMNDEGRVGGEGMLMDVFLKARRLAKEAQILGANQQALWARERYNKAERNFYEALKMLVSEKGEA